MRIPRFRALLVVGICAAVALASASCKSGPDDATINTAVQQKVAAELPTAKVSAATKEGVVTLTGDVETADAKTKAETAAKGVNGVKSVTNNITVKPAMPPPPPAAAGNDAAIQQAVADKIKAANVPGVTVNVAAGVATLTGTVKKGEMAKAVQAANEANPKATRVVNQIVEK